jgi:hypothetical protein
MKMKKILMVTAALLCATAANATADGCGVVTKTPDGFLNVREFPLMGTKIVDRLKPGAFVTADTAQCENTKTTQVCTNDASWTRVRYWMGGPNSDDVTSGWVASRYLKTIKCPEECAGGRGCD